MSKYYGKIGYANSIETKPGVFRDSIEVHEYCGDIIRNSSKWNTTSESTNDDLTVNVQISIISDPYASLNFHKMKYVEYMGTKWKITSVEPQYPRLILSLGGAYNGKQT